MSCGSDQTERQNLLDTLQCNGYKLQSSTIGGKNVTTIYNATSPLQQLTLIPSQTRVSERYIRSNQNLSNPCEGQHCSHIFVPSKQCPSRVFDLMVCIWRKAICLETTAWIQIFSADLTILTQWNQCDYVWVWQLKNGYIIIT